MLQNVSTYLKKLCDIGVLVEVALGKEKLFMHSKLIELLIRDDRFASYPGIKD